jgi:predicted HTH domain antitoxin
MSSAMREALIAMQITVQLPDDLAQHPNPGRDALEALAIEGYRSGALSAYQTRLMLGFETRYELDGFLKDHEVWDHAYSVEDLEKDAAGFERHA